MENRFEIQGSCLTVHLPKEVDHPVSDDIRRESDDIMRKQYIRTMVFDFSGTAFGQPGSVRILRSCFICQEFINLWKSAGKPERRRESLWRAQTEKTAMK